MQFQNNSNTITRHCFLCYQQYLLETDSKPIDGAYCTASKKPLRRALEYLVCCQKAKLQIKIPSDAVLCLKCYNEVMDYDIALCRALQKQRHLMQMLQNSAFKSEDGHSNNNNISSLEALAQTIDFESMHRISDEEIDRTVKEVFGSDFEMSKPDWNHEIPKNNQHIKRSPKHDASTKKRFKCKLCSFTHRNKDYVKLHMNIHEGRSEESCIFCYKQFCSKMNTIRHMESHLDTKRYQCDICGLRFSQSTVYSNHKLQHEAEAQPLQCELCMNTFKTKRTYQHHMITHRADRPRFDCEYCHKTFTERYSLKVHKRSSHPESQQLIQEAPNIVIAAECMQTQSDDIADWLEDSTIFTSSDHSCIICRANVTCYQDLARHMEEDHRTIIEPLTVQDVSLSEHDDIHT